jgi:hypothetical protein
MLLEYADTGPVGVFLGVPAKSSPVSWHSRRGRQIFAEARAADQQLLLFILCLGLVLCV